MRHPRTILTCLTLAAAYAGLNAQTPAPLGIFTNEGPVGTVTKGSMAAFDAARSEYRITAGGANIWAAVRALPTTTKTPGRRSRSRLPTCVNSAPKASVQTFF